MTGANLAAGRRLDRRRRDASASSIPASTSITRTSAATARPGRPRSRARAWPMATTSSATRTTPTRPARPYNPVPTPDYNPDDCGGHGTHVAGIVGANGAAQGRSTRRDLRRLPSLRLRGTTTSDIMLAAWNAPYNDGMQILEHEHRLVVPVAAVPDGGRRRHDWSRRAWSSSPRSATAGRAAARRRAVRAGAPGVGERVIGVASFDNTVVTRLCTHGDAAAKPSATTERPASPASAG